MRHWAPIAAYKLKKLIEQAKEGPFKWTLNAWMQDQIQHDDCDPSIGGKHILEMLDKIISGEVEGNKANRWLGWVQCAMVAAGITNLEEMKENNQDASMEWVICPSCNGKGSNPTARMDEGTTCAMCNGECRVSPTIDEYIAQREGR